jgi:translation initiation factor RLI1
MFDEVSSFLDVKQRLTVTQKIRNLVHNADEWPNGELDAMKKYVVSILCVSGCHMPCQLVEWEMSNF